MRLTLCTLAVLSWPPCACDELADSAMASTARHITQPTGKLVSSRYSEGAFRLNGRAF